MAIGTSHTHPLSLAAAAPATGLWLRLRRRRRRRLPGRLLVAPASKVRPDLICTLHRRRQLPHRLRDSQLHSLRAQQPRPLAVAGGRAAGTHSWAAARVSSPSSPTQPAHQQQSSPQHGAATAAVARVRVWRGAVSGGLPAPCSLPGSSSPCCCSAGSLTGCRQPAPLAPRTTRPSASTPPPATRSIEDHHCCAGGRCTSRYGHHSPHSLLACLRPRPIHRIRWSDRVPPSTTTNIDGMPICQRTGRQRATAAALRAIQPSPRAQVATGSGSAACASAKSSSTLASSQRRSTARSASTSTSAPRPSS
eukprot:COSAG01_NODE_2091_length_8453_cov_19.448049_6_plen_307_part_00